MTLHWWMHWFWVTALLNIQNGSGGTLPAPRREEFTGPPDSISSTTEHLDRMMRALYIPKSTDGTSTTKLAPVITTSTQRPNATVNTTIEEKHTKQDNQTKLNATTEIAHPSVLVDAVVVNVTEANITKATEIDHDVANETLINATENATVRNPKRRNNLTRYPDPKDLDSSGEGASESRIVTEKPLSLETTFLQTRIPPSNIESSRRVIEQPSSGGMDTGEIAGISFAALVLAALAGSTAFVLYRRRYLNKPQTLNDKCSNPDSSGYLDDSTDNSEEMYSLDNDSFLNSLEAMTIQNYWTDTVKHTKL